MTDTPQADMAEATRLTRAGRLSEATALIQRLLHGSDTAGSHRSAAATRAAACLHRFLDGLRGLVRGEPEQAADPAGRAGASPPPASPTPRAPATTSSMSPVAAGDRPLPLVVMLHGCTQSPDDFAAGTRMNALAEEHGCYVAYPEQNHAPTPSAAGTGSSPATRRATRASPR